MGNLGCERSVGQVYKMALNYLTARPRTVAEMRTRLQKSFSSGPVDSVIVRLTQDGLLDDLAFARRWRESRQKTRPRSMAFLRRELVRRGVPKELAVEAVTGVDDEEVSYHVAMRYVRRLAGVEGPTFWRRLGQHLYRRGFTPGVIRRTLQRYWCEQKRDAEVASETGA